MWIKKKEVEKLSEFVKGYISGEKFDIRDNREGAFQILKNDIYALVNRKNEQIKVIESERDILSDYMADISHQLKTPITSMMIMADLLEDAEPHGSRENAQVEKTGVEHRVDIYRFPPGKQYTQNRKQHEGAAHYPQMQSPVTTASNNRLTRQLRAVHKEQQGNRCGGQIFKEGDEIASGRKERGQQHHRDQG